MSEYAAGTKFERKVRTDLRDNGYEVIRSAGSKTKVDLVAMKPGELLLVQCKRDGTLPPDEWDRLYDLARWISGYPILASNGERGRGVRYDRLLDHKRRGVRIEQTVPFVLDEVAEVAT